MNKKSTILYHLQQNTTLTLQQLSLLLDSPPHSIRARISELKKLHPIISEYHPTRYSLFLTNPIIQYIEENKLFNTPINIKNLSIHLSIPLTEIETHLASLFSSPIYSVFQQNPNTIIISKK